MYQLAVDNNVFRLHSEVARLSKELSYEKHISKIRYEQLEDTKAQRDQLLRSNNNLERRMDVMHEDMQAHLDFVKSEVQRLKEENARLKELQNEKPRNQELESMKGGQRKELPLQ